VTQAASPTGAASAAHSIFAEIPRVAARASTRAGSTMISRLGRLSVFVDAASSNRSMHARRGWSVPLDQPAPNAEMVIARIALIVASCRTAEA